MATYIVTAFSFLAASLGWFDGASQTEIFFWAEIVAEAVILVVVLALVLAGTGIRGGGFLSFGTLSLIGAMLLALRFGLVLLISWICTQLWGTDFFLSFQLLAIGAATGSLFNSSNKND